ncbi:MAG: TonB-dependent receptor [Acidobacteriota bacterium]
MKLCSFVAGLASLFLVVPSTLAFDLASEAAEAVPREDVEEVSETVEETSEEAAESSPEVVEDSIVVTGSLIQDDLQDTPESVAVWQSDAITDAALRELQDIYNQTANVYQIGNGEGFGIRGINHNSVGTGGGGELGSYYIDGVAFTGFSKRFGPMHLWDVEQVEILRGPQTTNVGRNALAGAVLMQTKSPTMTNASSWRLGAASESTWEGAAAVNAQVGDNSAVRFTAEYWETEGFVSNPTRNEDDFDARENLTLRGKWLYQPQERGDGVQALFSVQYGETSRGNDTIDFADRDARQNFSNLDDFEDNESLMLAMDLTWALGDTWSVRSITSYLDSDYDRFDDDDQSPGGGNSNRARTAVDRNWAEDLRLEYAIDRVRGVSGIYYTQVDLDNDTSGETNLRPIELGIPAFLLPLYPNPIRVAGELPAEFETTNLAVFTHWDWDVNERWSAFAGLRWDSEEQDSEQFSRTFLISTLPDPTAPGLPPQLAGAIAQVNALLESQLGTSEISTSTDYDAFLPEAGISHQWTDDVTSSLFYKRGYRAGGAELNLVGRQNEFDPEFLDLVELSLRANVGRAVVNGNLYFGSWNDQQVNVQQSASTLDFITENAGESEIYGVELETNYQAVGRWNIYGALGFAHTEFTDFQSATEGDLSGNRFAGAPEVTAAIGGNFRFGKGWFVHGDVNYQGDAFATVDNDIELDERTILNFRLGYETARYSLIGYVNNVSDETYAVTAFQSVDGRDLGKLGAPRAGGLQFTVRF